MTKELKTRQVSKSQQYRIDVRQIVENHNPRNALPPAIRATGRYTLFGPPIEAGILIELWDMGINQQAECRAEFCRVIEMDEDFVSWAATFLSTGQLEAVELRDNGRKGDSENTYTLVFGARRCLAILYNWAKQGGRGTPWVSAVLAPKMNQTGLLHRSVIENIREDPNPMEIARAIQLAINQQQTEEEIARIYGKSPSWVKMQLALLALPVEVQKKVESRTLKPTKALEEVKPKSDSPPKISVKVWKDRTQRLGEAGSKLLAYIDSRELGSEDAPPEVLALIAELREAINALK